MAEETPVGVTIAYQRISQATANTEHQNQQPQQHQPQQQPPTTPPRRGSSSASLQQLAQNRQRRRRRQKTKKRRYSQRQQQIKRKAGKITKPISSWTVFWEGALLYTACLVLPALVGSIYRFWMYGDSLRDLIESSVFWTQLCSSSSSSSSSSSWWTMTSKMTTHLLLCGWLRDPEERPLMMPPPSSINSDVWMVVWCSIALAILRLLIVQWTVMPLQSTDQLEAMIRCKSVHLLSSDYSQTPTIGTPVLKNRRRGRHYTNDGQVPPLPSLTVVPQDSHDEQINPHYHLQPAVGLGIDDSDRDEDADLFLSFGSRLIGQQQHLLPSQQPNANNIGVAEVSPPPEDDNDNHEDDDDDEDDEDDADLMEELADRLAAVVTATETGGHAAATSSTPPLTTPTTTTTTRSLYAGPRYATALFRLLYSTVAASLAWYFFYDANFWPWYVGGTGSTANSWDLSGGLTMSGLDADFDQHNHVLKQYFLWQASYHWHSGAFHILSVVLVLWHPPEDRHPTGGSSTQDNRRRRGGSSIFWPLRTNNTSTYLRSIIQHVIGLGTIAVAYVFSSLRRLTAIGLFAFDVSSWSLHLLQVCINAPPESPLTRVPAATLHKYVVVPAFFWARLGVWPALMWSALKDSERWLEQLERTLWPGSARQLRILLSVQFTLLLVSTTVYGKRLLYHDHVRRVGGITGSGREKKER